MRMSEIFCDRCGKRLIEVDAYRIGLPYMNIESVYGGGELLAKYQTKKLNLIEHDLCVQCMSELVDFVYEHEKENKIDEKIY